MKQSIQFIASITLKLNQFFPKISNANFNFEERNQLINNAKNKQLKKAYKAFKNELETQGKINYIKQKEQQIKIKWETFDIQKKLSYINKKVKKSLKVQKVKKQESQKQVKKRKYTKKKQIKSIINQNQSNQQNSKIQKPNIVIDVDNNSLYIAQTRIVDKKQPQTQ